ncbi:MAG: enoyl-CoA hydratase/isomerase family protein [Thermodesulfobacteriota bacterium]
MTLVTWEKSDTIARVAMTNGENRQNLDFANEMNRVLEEVKADPAVTALILTSSDPKYWSLGVDVDWIGQQMQAGANDQIKAFMYGMNAVFTQLLLYPVPVIGALNGHAFGNGAILACACDFRLMRADRGYFCFPEVDLGIPFLPGMIEMVKKAVPHCKFNELKLTGKRAGAAELQSHHVIEKVSENEQSLTEDALAFAAMFHKKRGIFAEHKKRLHRPVIEAMEIADPEYIESLFLFVND